MREQCRVQWQAPDPSRGHFGFVYDPNHDQTFLYGGYTTTATDEFWVWKDDTWEWDGQQWNCQWNKGHG